MDSFIIDFDFQAIIFCRTKLDCDNLERLFSLNGGGPRADSDHQFSCVCLHSDRKPHERNENLDAFKKALVRVQNSHFLEKIEIKVYTKLKLKFW